MPRVSPLEKSLSKTVTEIQTLVERRNIFLIKIFKIGVLIRLHYLLSLLHPKFLIEH